MLLDRNSEENSNNNLVRLDNQTIINLKNIGTKIEYISLSKGGKIMIINPSFYNNLYVKLDSLLAFNNGIELFFDKWKNRIFDTFFFYKRLISYDNLRRNLYINDTQSELQFYLIKPKIKLNFENTNFQGLSSLIFYKNNTINDLLFLSGENSLFEKRLGEGESFVLNTNSLIAFEGSVTFDLISKKTNYVNMNNHIKVTGPGLIIFEYGKKIFYDSNNKRRKIILIFSIISIFFHLLAYFALIHD